MLSLMQGTKYAAGSGILDAGTLTVGKDGAFSIDGGVVNVGNSLTVTEAYFKCKFKHHKGWCS